MSDRVKKAIGSVLCSDLASGKSCPHCMEKAERIYARVLEAQKLDREGTRPHRRPTRHGGQMTTAAAEDTQGVPNADLEADNAFIRDLDEEMIRVGPPLGLYQETDAYGHLVPRWVVPRPGWLSRAMWHEVTDFQQPVPPLPPNFPLQEYLDSLRDTRRWNEAPWALEVDRKIKLNPSKGVVWTLVVHSGKYGLTSFDAVLGEERVVSWGWLESTFGFPIVRAYCAIKNFMHRRVFGPARRFFLE